MTTLQHDLPRDVLDTAAVRGLSHLPPDMQRRGLLQLLVAIEAGNDGWAAGFVAAMRRCENGLPMHDPTTYTRYTWDEWQAEFGSGVNAPDESGGRAQ